MIDDRIEGCLTFFICLLRLLSKPILTFRSLLIAFTTYRKHRVAGNWEEHPQVNLLQSTFPIKMSKSTPTHRNGTILPDAADLDNERFPFWSRNVKGARNTTIKVSTEESWQRQSGISRAKVQNPFLSSNTQIKSSLSLSTVSSDLLSSGHHRPILCSIHLLGIHLVAHCQISVSAKDVSTSSCSTPSNLASISPFPIETSTF